MGSIILVNDDSSVGISMVNCFYDGLKKWPDRNGVKIGSIIHVNYDSSNGISMVSWPLSSGLVEILLNTTGPLKCLSWNEKEVS
ncbi:hypothetical protein TNIN_299061 [Trichonephila inaurata madagascariensis]|uniref:Uncharacterized protein n=1 Tax=Trichonephila inaurata madagascariensis TaxID=2747483 RepID=A0A8X6YV42_9ARAC|nr:hypothetical protein TNIN_299061 [Trichonephila inaurata madagascariensis]